MCSMMAVANLENFAVADCEIERAILRWKPSGGLCPRRTVADDPKDMPLQARDVRQPPAAGMNDPRGRTRRARNRAECDDVFVVAQASRECQGQIP